MLLLLSFLLQKLGIVVIVCTDDDDDDRDKDKDEANESINPSAMLILESAHLLRRLKRPHRCNIFFSFEGSSEIQKNSFHTVTTNSYKSTLLLLRVVLTSVKTENEHTNKTQ